MLGNDHDDHGRSRRGVLKGIGALGAAAIGGTGLSGSATARIGDSAVYQYYHTDWPTITENLDSVAAAGYDAIQVPPAQFSRLYKYERVYDEEKYDIPLGYQPIDYRNFDSQFGTESEYAAMVEEAHAQGLEVIADAVMNHMAAGGDYFDRQVSLDDLPMFSGWDFHDGCAIDDSDPESVENCWLSGLRDLDQDSQYVREQLRNYMEKYANLGVDGIRYDAAKHISESFFRNYANQWADELGLYRVGEVLDGSVATDQGYADTGMSVTDFALYFTMKEDVFHSGGDMRVLDDAGLVNQDPLSAMTFVSNHDYGPPEYERLAYAYVLTYEGYPRVYNHRIDVDDPQISELLAIRRQLLGGAATTRHVDTDLYVYERGDAIVVLNRGETWDGQWVPTDFASGSTLSDVTGSAADTTVNGDGWVEVAAPPVGYAVYATESLNFEGGSGDGGSDEDNTGTTDRTPIRDGRTYAIRNGSSDLALEVEGASYENGANVHVRTYADGHQPHWIVESVGDGYYRLLTTHSGKALDVDGASTADGANVHQWDYVGGENQQWAIEETAGGYLLRARHSGKVLEAAGLDDGTNVVQNSENGTEAQVWTFELL